MRHAGLCFVVTAFVVLHSCLALAQDQETGVIKGQFVLEGDIPTLAPKLEKGGPVGAGAAVCAKDGVPNETLLVDAESKGVANVVIYLRKAPPNMPEAAKASAEKNVEFDQKDCRFLPHVVALRTDQTMMCTSSDPIAHNLHTNPFKNPGINVVIAPNADAPTPVTMKLVETLPVKVTCDIHSWMEAYWVVTDHPYVAVTDEKGNFTIEHLPVGKHSFTVWHESVGYVNRSFEVDVKAGDNDIPVQKFAVIQTGEKFKLKK